LSLNPRGVTFSVRKAFMSHSKGVGAVYLICPHNQWTHFS
jgi:hypothetical protein